MKPIKKKTAKLFTVLIALALVVGVLFAFVPMPFKNNTFTSILGSINKSTDLVGGVYAEYELEEEYSDAKINGGISVIRDILEEKGYSGANVFALSNKKIRIEIGHPGKYGSLKTPYSLLSSIDIGTFELRSSSSEEDTYVVGHKHISGADIKTYGESVYVSINFNKAGEEAYAELIKAVKAGNKSIYVYMGGQMMTSFDAGNIEPSSSMPLTFNNYPSAKDFEIKVKLGSMGIELKEETVNINTMSSTLNSSHYETNPNAKYFGVSSTLIAAIVAIVVVVLLSVGFMAIKNGIMGLMQFIALIFDTVIALFFIWAFPWVEVSLSSLIAIALGYALVLSSSFIYVSRVQEEYSQGKTVTASLESGYKKSLNPVLATGIVLTIIFGIVAIVASGELRVFGLITCIFSCLAMFNTAVMLPGFVNIFEAFNDGAAKPYLFKNKEGKENEK